MPDTLDPALEAAPAAAAYENMRPFGGRFWFELSPERQEELTRMFEAGRASPQPEIDRLREALRGIVAAYEAKSDEPDERVSAWMNALAVLGETPNGERNG